MTDREVQTLFWKSNCQLYSQFSLLNLCCQEPYVMQGEISVIILLANGTLGVRYPTSFPNRKVSDEFLDRDKASCVRQATMYYNK